jgi:hypothetical protein
VLDNHSVELGTQDKEFCFIAWREQKEVFWLFHESSIFTPSIFVGKITLATTLCTWSPDEVVHCLVSSGFHDLVSYVQYLWWYPHIRAWSRHIKCVIKHTDKEEYVGEDMTPLSHHQWNRGRRRAALWGREREERVDNKEAAARDVGSSSYDVRGGGGFSGGVGHWSPSCGCTGTRPTAPWALSKKRSTPWFSRIGGGLWTPATCQGTQMAAPNFVEYGGKQRKRWNESAVWPVGPMVILTCRPFC